MINLRENAAVTRHAEGNMIPVINMTFLLLLFFIVVGSFSENINQDISPPQSVTETMADPAVVEFELTREGQLLWQGSGQAAVDSCDDGEYGCIEAAGKLSTQVGVVVQVHRPQLRLAGEEPRWHAAREVIVGEPQICQILKALVRLRNCPR